MNNKKYYAGVETGGTKVFVAIGDVDGNILDRVKINTTTPDETVPQIIQHLKNYQTTYPFEDIGVGAFGPLDPIKSSPTYGYIKNTPKLAWANFDFISAIKKAFPSANISFDTDVNGAALAEKLWGAGKTVNNLTYITIGTGIGAGIIQNGQLMHGGSHVEAGHFYPARHPQDTFEGSCPYHGHCLEGLASGPSILKRWDIAKAEELSDDHIAWEIESYYIAQAIHNYLCCYTSEKIILGGGVMQKSGMIEQIRVNVKKLLNGYLDYTAVQDIDNLIIPASFGDNTGVKGTIALAITNQP